MIEMGDLLAEVKVLEKGGASLSGLEGVLVVVDPEALVRREELPGGILAIRVELVDFRPL
jgi:hypothetical protein